MRITNGAEQGHSPSERTREPFPPGQGKPTHGRMIVLLSVMLDRRNISNAIINRILSDLISIILRLNITLISNSNMLLTNTSLLSNLTNIRLLNNRLTNGKTINSCNITLVKLRNTRTLNNILMKSSLNLKRILLNGNLNNQTELSSSNDINIIRLLTMIINHSINIVSLNRSDLVIRMMKVERDSFLLALKHINSDHSKGIVLNTQDGTQGRHIGIVISMLSVRTRLITSDLSRLGIGTLVVTIIVLMLGQDMLNENTSNRHAILSRHMLLKTISLLSLDIIETTKDNVEAENNIKQTTTHRYRNRHRNTHNNGYTGLLRLRGRSPSSSPI